MAKQKSVNYTKEQESRMNVVYNPDAAEVERVEAVELLAEEFDKSTRSIIAKLTAMQLYVPKTYKSKTGKAPEKKESIVTDIAKALEVNELPGLEKATKNTLLRIRKALTA